MAWTSTQGSAVFQQWLRACMDRTANFNMETDTFFVALYNNTGTPDKNATAANTAYAAGQWVSGNEVSSGVNWPTGGVSLPNPTVNVATAGVVFWDGDNVLSGSTATITNAYGCLVYSPNLTTPVDNQSVCFNYFGGPNSVTNGLFTINWSDNGIWRATI